MHIFCLFMVALWQKVSISSVNKFHAQFPELVHDMTMGES